MTIYQATKEFLIEHFDPNCAKCEFGEDDTHELIKRIQTEDPDYRGVDSIKKEEVRQAFLDFFINVGKVAIFFKGTEKMIVKLIPYEVHPNESVYIKKICAYVQSIAEELDKENDQESIIVIPERYVEEMEHMLKEISIPVNARQMIKKAIFEGFKLTEKDIVLFMNRKVIIRFFCEDNCERRLEGLPQDEVAAIVENFYRNNPENDMASDLEMIISSLTDSTLDFREIDNIFFDSYHIKLIQNAIVEYIRRKISQPDIILTAAANYIFRESFYFIHELLAEKLLELIAKRDKNAENFLRFYNGETTMSNGQKFIVNEIIDDKELVWTVPMIQNFISQYTKAEAKVKKTELTLRALSSEQTELTLDNSDAVEAKRRLEFLRLKTGTLQSELMEHKKHYEGMLDEYDNLVGAISRVLMQRRHRRA